MRICNNCGNTERFTTTAHVSQTWVVDGEGGFIEEVSTDDVTHKPHPDNTWTCYVCDSFDTVEKL